MIQLSSGGLFEILVRPFFLLEFIFIFYQSVGQNTRAGDDEWSITIQVLSPAHKTLQRLETLADCSRSDRYATLANRIHQELYSDLCCCYIYCRVTWHFLAGFLIWIFPSTNSPKEKGEKKKRVVVHKTGAKDGRRSDCFWRHTQDRSIINGRNKVWGSGKRKREMIALYKRRQLHPYSAAVPPAAKRKV